MSSRKTLNSIGGWRNALSYSQRGPFVDGNKRTGHAAMETFLVLNGYEIEATVDEQERIIQVAAGELGRNEFTDWLRSRVVEKNG
jgi:death-on-curing protein